MTAKWMNKFKDSFPSPAPRPEFIRKVQSQMHLLLEAEKEQSVSANSPMIFADSEKSAPAAVNLFPEEKAALSDLQTDISSGQEILSRNLEEQPSRNIDARRDMETEISAARMNIFSEVKKENPEPPNRTVTYISLITIGTVPAFFLVNYFYYLALEGVLNFIFPPILVQSFIIGFLILVSLIASVCYGVVPVCTFLLLQNSENDGIFRNRKIRDVT